MPTPLPAEFFWDSNFELGPDSASIAQRVWPNYLASPSDIPEPSLTLEIPIDEFMARYPAWGVRRKQDSQLVAYSNAVFVQCDLDSGELPEEGWQFAIQAGARQTKANCLCLVIANVDPSVQNQKLSYHLIEVAKAAALSAGLDTLIAPVRPSLKHAHPDMSIEEYVQLRQANGEHFDPWLRVHERSGGHILNICYRSTVVTATLKKWREWTGLAIAQSGRYSLQGGIAPLLADVDNNLGTYTEPNVWVRYRLTFEDPKGPNQ